MRMDYEKEWISKYALAKKYYEYYGDLNIPAIFCTKDGYTKDNSEDAVKLGHWIQNVRAAYKNGTLKQDRIEQLESIGMIWSIRKRVILDWDSLYELAKIYFDHYGNVDIPQKFLTKNGYSYDDSEGYVKLGMWIQNQRSMRKSGILSNNKIEKLNKLNMTWSMVSDWDAMYLLATKYYEQFKNLDITGSFKTINGYTYDDSEGYVKLGMWVRHQRLLYKRNKLSNEKIEKLEKIGIRWNAQHDWEYYYKYLLIYYENHQNIDIPVRFATVNGYTEDKINGKVKLGDWLQSQRQDYKKGILCEDKIEKLESLGITWVVRKHLSWEEMYKLLINYYNYNGNIDLKYDFYTIDGYSEVSSEDGINLGCWLHKQRPLYRSGKLSSEKIKLLEDLGMKWQIRKVITKMDNIKLCDIYFLDYRKYPDLLNIPYKVLYSKIEFIKQNHMLLQINGYLNPVFFMGDENLKVMHGITMKELVDKYYNLEEINGKTKKKVK